MEAGRTPLTAADSASHDFLLKSLRVLFPDALVISEESEESVRKLAAACNRFWLVDPADGTKEFLKGTNEFTVNVALIEAGQPMLGVVHGKLFEILFSGRQSWSRNSAIMTIGDGDYDWAGGAHREAEKLISMPGCSHAFCVLLQIRWRTY